MSSTYLILRAATPVLLFALLAGGCAPQDQIAHYSIPKPESIETPLIRPAGGGGMPSAGGPMSGPGSSRPAPAGDLEFVKPEGWSETAPKQFTMKAFELTDGNERVEITISAAGGDMTANMNRWRGQVKLPDTSPEELAKAFQPIEVNGQAGKFIEMSSPEGVTPKQTILGAVVEEGERTWFIKLRGDAALAERERKSFEAFAASVKW